MVEDSIFHPSFGNKPDNLVGREAELNTLLQCFDSYPGMRERAVLITGQRGMGKTAMLLEASDLASSKGFVAVRTTCGAALLNNVLDGLQHAGNQLIVRKSPPIKMLTRPAPASREIRQNGHSRRRRRVRGSMRDARDGDFHPLTT